MELDAIVLSDALSSVAIAGLSAGERAVRVARRAGATRVWVLDRTEQAARPIAASPPGDLAPHLDRAGHDLVAWRAGRTCPVLVVRADQLVHSPLVAPLVAAPPADGIAIAVGPDDAYAGALLATGARAAHAIEALARGDSDAAIAAAATARVPHGEIARHPIATPEQRSAAHRMLYRILIKPQDNAITRYLYRPISFRLTRLLVWTPITPNQVSYLVAALVAIGCWLTAHARMDLAISGTAIILAASYLDCCDGEIARVKLMSSRLGAWIDTIVDELSSVGYMVALGWHCHLAFGRGYLGDLGFDPWIAALGLGVLTYGWSMYCIYYNIIVGVGSANSQDYAGSFEVIPGAQPNSVRLRPAIAKAIAPRRELPRWLAVIATYAPYLIRRDFIAWGALVLVILHWTQISFASFILGGVGTSMIVTIDHVKLRRLRRSIRRGGQLLEPAS
ncbi:MAG TPA: CDP-alcohol phosphatidyltransferase family protein [Kofleriaceae bacterium]|jgi:phosphatidylglycerophosphate synthase|nr:CDP-alcohol phosphatidyltransferase family protein [Kofleriaceae bacterium]